MWKFNQRSSVPFLLTVISLFGGHSLFGQAAKEADVKNKTIKVFILAGDENVLEQAPIDGRTDGIHEDFYPHANPEKDEKKKHVNCSVYTGGYDPKTNYDALKPVATALVEIGEQRTRRAHEKKRGREPVPMAPFPEQSKQNGFTTVLRGYVSVPYSGVYEFLPGKGDAVFNVTTVDGKQVYTRRSGQEKAGITRIQLDPNKRYAFKTVFIGKPSPDFRLPLLNKPGTLSAVVDENKEYNFLKDKEGKWVTRDDVVLCDFHPIHNNDRTVGRFLQVGDVSYGGKKPTNAMGPELMLGHVLGDSLEEPVLILRFGTRDPIWFWRGSRTLSHDYRPPSSAGGSDLNGGWDVIHFNWGVWDTGRPIGKSSEHDKTKRPVRVPIDAYEKNLREIVGKLKKTGATLIWASTTPLHEGCPSSIKGDELTYNAVAEKIMRENGVIINDLYAESIRLGYPKRPDVHSVGALAPKVITTISTALAERKNKTKPLPRVLLIGDSITGSYQRQVMKEFDGKAYVCKNPGNGEHSGTGVAKIDEWIDLKRYRLNGQEYLELVDGVKSAMNDLGRVYPGYKGQGAELAGLIWFQGIKDSGSTVKAADYGQHLPNLIRDLRKDLNAPKLPVVVAAIGFGGTTMSTRAQQVFDAQMAVGDPKQFPQFSGNVASVDTRPFYPSADHSPGATWAARPMKSSVCYNENATAFLAIGKAMGTAMVTLREQDK